jgi:hypothetical protein
MGITFNNVTIGAVQMEVFYLPSEPTIGTASRVSGSNSQIDITYTASSSNGGLPITSYTAVSTPDNITGSISQASSGTIRVSGLTQGTSYTFVVYATSSIGNSANSAASNSIIPAVVPSAPTIGTASRVSGSNTQLDITYTAPVDNGGLPITSYTATSTPDSITGTISQASSGTIRVSGLTSGTNYTFVVKATNAIGDSPNSAASNSISPAIVPTAPTIGTAIRVSGSGTQIDVPYTASSSNGGNAITSYTATSTPGSITGTISQASSGTIRVSGLTQGTSYTFIVKATNSVGDSPNSAASNSIAPAVVPTAPTIGTASRVSGSNTQIDVTYTASSSDGGNAITSYTATSTPGSITGTISQASSGTIRVSGLTAGTSYTFVVKATNSVGDSPNSAASNSIIPAVVPTAPTIGTATPINTTTATVTYTASSSNGGNAITSYTAVSTPGSITGTVSQASSGTITVTGLTQGTSYTFVVYATNSVGNSPNSAASNSAIPGTVPSQPTIGTASFSANVATIPFTAPSNGGPPITSHTAVSYPDNLTASVSQASSGNIVISSGFITGQAYTFTVYATNVIGNSPISANSNTVTAGAPNYDDATYTTPGTYSWVAPVGVSNISVVAIGGGGGGNGRLCVGLRRGGGGGGGGLVWLNGYPVTANSSYTVVVGGGGTNGGSASPGGCSHFVNIPTAGAGGGVRGFANGLGSQGGSYVVSTSYGTSGGGNGGGSPGLSADRQSAGGGGAGGYTGSGGQGGGMFGNGGSGAGGGGGGGGGGYTASPPAGNGAGQPGGGTGIYGEGPSGAGGIHVNGSPSGGYNTVGNGGSGGSPGTSYAMGGLYGGGGGGTCTNSIGEHGRGGNGAVRILWGAGRAFPSTNVTGAPINYPLQTTVGTVTTSTGTVTVPFTAACANGGTITQHRAISTPGNVIASVNQASSGNIVYSNNFLLTAGTSYTFKVYAINGAGAGPQSPASNSITYSGANAQAEYTTPGTYTWVAPVGVSSVSVVAVGGGGGATSYAYCGIPGGSGGGLGYKNNISVTAGNSYTVVAGAAPIGGSGGDSYFNSTCIVRGGGGFAQCTTNAGTYTGDGGGNGGVGGAGYSGGPSDKKGGGGGGAGGYSGTGGSGGVANPSANGTAGSGGGGGGGGAGSSWFSGAGGGGVSLYGSGPSGAGAGQNVGGGGGSGGANGGNPGPNNAGIGGDYGGGSGGGQPNLAVPFQRGGNGAVRIIWGTGRSFPSTNTANTTI